MEASSHQSVSAIYHTEALAHKALERLRSNGFTDSQLRVLGPVDHKPKTTNAATLEPDRDGVAKHVIKDTLLGAGAGGALGAAGSAALAATHMAVFMTNPVVGALITGYSTAVGGVLGAFKSINYDENKFLETAQNALKRGYWIVVVHSRTQEQHDRANQLLAVDAESVDD
jgi:hypothetical protein